MDPRDAQILELTAALEKHPGKQPHGSGGYSGSGYSGSKEETIPGMNSLKKWRTIKKRHFQTIVENGHVYDAETYRRHILDALLSGPNANFNTRMKSIKSDVDAGYGYNANVTPATILMSAKQLYTNISRLNEWSKVDPRDAQILELTTALEKQPGKQQHGSVGYISSVYVNRKKRQSQA